ncbi:hypothetical protein F5H01DRAFT_362220 [Linnemannia elongata]|nr:hypothetical protein F5H01DRAFT_362220 [Linnemannia elongata]
MALSTVRKVRAFVLFLTTVNLGLTITSYIFISNLPSRALSSGTGIFPLEPIHYLEIAAASFIFFGYLYSLCCNLYKLNRIFRAVLMSVLAIALITVQVIFIVKQIQDSNDPFSCQGERNICYVSNANLFVAIITGLLALAEVVVTLVDILISGAGLIGLFPGIVLVRVNTPYTAFERTPEVKSLGLLDTFLPPPFACGALSCALDNQMLDGISDLKTPYGIMSDLFDASPTELVSKVYFEDKYV